MANVMPAHFLPADKCRFSYVEKSSPRSSHLQWLTYGVYELAGPSRARADRACGRGAAAILLGRDAERPALGREGVLPGALRRPLCSPRSELPHRVPRRERPG